ncbi:Polyisoprenoid-binding protein YceI [Hymenobacter daecheongensis DSM 21074]|uniref:Polyisoprenoid-binding protein YceI n=1 Tax=Hymenobacter daecheongensis DSM 21074 TaxID=1121955 RepID=A0A1M6C0Y5_9BACT|nr:YceI family protein [Hymenobacter daecheongensis]SHI54682.1 Polyisoprenoid-binding protein YceI [Hymenobacter daecheongensis DSM 21074]
MKLLLLILLTSLLAAAQPAATTYRIDPAASRLTWTGHAEAGDWAPTGAVQLRQGRFDYAGTRLQNGRFEFDMATISHSDTQLQEHLRGTDFFDVARFPTAVFTLRALAAGQVVGELTLKGISRPVRFPATFSRQPDGSLRVRGTASIDRTEFGVNYNSTSFFQNLGSYAIRNDFQLAFELVARPVR